MIIKGKVLLGCQCRQKRAIAQVEVGRSSHFTNKINTGDLNNNRRHKTSRDFTKNDKPPLLLNHRSTGDDPIPTNRLVAYDNGLTTK